MHHVADQHEKYTGTSAGREIHPGTQVFSGSGSPDSQPYQQGDYVVWGNPDSSRKKLQQRTETYSSRGLNLFFNFYFLALPDIPLSL